MKTINQTQLDQILERHKLWLEDNEKGERADLRYANLRDVKLQNADLRGANLRGANLQNANLRYADLQYANLLDADLRGANLQNANLRYANLRDADLRGANLRYADLQYANLRDADLRCANLRGANLRGANLSGAMLECTLIDDTIVSVSQIGSRNGITTYNVTNDILWCGCFNGTLSEFEKAVETTHANNPQYRDEYRAAIEFFKQLKHYNYGTKTYKEVIGNIHDNKELLKQQEL